MFELIEVNLNQFQWPGARFRDSPTRGSSLARCVRDDVSARSARVAGVALAELVLRSKDERIDITRLGLEKSCNIASYNL